MTKPILKTEMMDITLAKAVAIILVVIGHVPAGGVSKGNEWFNLVVDDIYLFHMPFFMFVSGFLFFRLGRIEKLTARAGSFISEQAVRMLLPFFTIGALIVLGKIIMQQVVHVDNVPDNAFAGFINLIWYTGDSASVFLWYIFALFVYSAISLIIFKFLKYKMILWVGLGAIIYMMPAIDYVYLDKLTLFFLFFVLGGYARIHEDQYKALMRSKVAIAAYFVLFATVIVAYRYQVFDIDYKFYKLLAGLSCIPVLMKFCEWLASFTNKFIATLAFVGRHTYVIYLFNTICIGLTKAVVFLVVGWDYAMFWLVLPVLILAGILGPLIGEWLVLKRIPFINKRILGN